VESSSSTQGLTGNQLLDMLPTEERQRIGSSTTAIPMNPGRELHASQTRISHVYFPTDGVASLMTPSEEGWVETAVVGNEGMVGIRAFLGGGTSGNERAIGQVDGSALQMSADTFRGLTVETGGKLGDLMFSYTQALMAQTAQSVVCNAVHDIPERCARWLLQVHDRVHGDEFGLTHEFLSDMLAVRRSSVTVAAGTLQNAGIIRYHRGRISIADRKALEEASCECYMNTKNEYTNVMNANADTRPAGSMGATH
jgi:CRP-like cAMP-binding protein